MPAPAVTLRPEMPRADNCASTAVSTADAASASVVPALICGTDTRNFSSPNSTSNDRFVLSLMFELASPSTKVMVDVEGGNNLLYLPLDKIMEENKKKGDDDE